MSCAPALRCDTGVELDAAMDLGTWSPFTTQMQHTSNVCAWSDTQGTGYQVSVSGQGAGGQYSLVSGAGDAIALTVEWRSSLEDNVWETLVSGLPGLKVGTYDATRFCSSDTIAQLRVRVEMVDIESAAAGSYSGGLVLSISPI